MTTRVKVSKKSQIAIPPQSGVNFRSPAGDHLIMEVRDGYAVLIPEPKHYSQHLHGLHREVWERVGAQFTFKMAGANTWPRLSPGARPDILRWPR